MGRPRKIREPKPCDVCGKEFINRDKRVKTCSRECGKALATINHPVKATRTPRECIGCGNEFLPHRENRPQKYCTQECLWTHKPRKPRTDSQELVIMEHSCAHCGYGFMSLGNRDRKYCSTKCRDNFSYNHNPDHRDRVLARAHARRADKLGLGSAKVVLSHLIERDENICGICKREVTDTTGPMRPSMDHIIPLSRGGEHSMQNLQLAHLQCNLSKGNRLEIELMAA